MKAISPVTPLISSSGREVLSTMLSLKWLILYTQIYNHLYAVYEIKIKQRKTIHDLFLLLTSLLAVTKHDSRTKNINFATYAMNQISYVHKQMEERALL